MSSESQSPDERGWNRLVSAAWDDEPPASDAVLAAWRRKRSGRVARVLRVAAAAAAVFVVGLVGGRYLASGPAAPDGSRYVLLLYGQGTDEAPEASLVAEYRGWAERLKDAGVATSGERLGDEAWPLGDGAVQPDQWPLTGYFIISAPSADSAVAIARGTPHLRHGGRVVVRHIEPT